LAIDGMRASIRYILKDIFWRHLVPLDTPLPFDYLSLTIDELMIHHDNLQRSLEIAEINKRAFDKINGIKAKPSRSDISVVRDILRMRKFVITWPHMKYESEMTSS
jgi:hypothetical protein